MNERLLYLISLAACLWVGCAQPAARTAQVESFIKPRSTPFIPCIDRGMDGMTFEPRTIWVPYAWRAYPVDSISDSVEYLSYRRYALDTAYVNQMFSDLQPYPDTNNGYAPSGALIHVIWEDHVDTFRISKSWVLYDHEKQFVVNPSLRHYLLSIMPEGMRQNWEGDFYTHFDPSSIYYFVTPEEADSINEAQRREMRRLGKSEAEINASIFDEEKFMREIDSINRLISEPPPEPAVKR